VSFSAAADGARLLSGIRWDEGTPERVKPEIVRLLGAACLVESRGDSYGAYLGRVFCDDPEFLKSIALWSQEENEHGIVLGTWLTRSFPDFNFSALFEKYTQGLKLAYEDSNDQASIRGSKAAELLSRCSVESATSTYYKTVRDLVDDSSLKDICSRLSRDEIKHFTLFCTKLDEQRYKDEISTSKLLCMSISRLFEAEDDQMSYAYYVACNTDAPYERGYYSTVMAATAFGLYTKERISELIKLNVRALNLADSLIGRVVGYKNLVSTLTNALYLYIKARHYLANLKLKTLYRGRSIRPSAEEACNG